MIRFMKGYNEQRNSQFKLTMSQFLSALWKPFGFLFSLLWKLIKWILTTLWQIFFWILKKILFILCWIIPFGWPILFVYYYRKYSREYPGESPMRIMANKLDDMAKGRS